MKKKIRILGIDPGYAIVGYGVIDYAGNSFKVVEYGGITTDSKLELPERLLIIYNELSALSEKYRPDAMSVEELFFNNNAKTAINVGQARGVILLSAQIRGGEIFEYTPLQVKQAVVGYGRAEKNQVQQMVKMLLSLEKIPKPDDVADALAIAVCHAHSHNANSRLSKLIKERI